MLRSLVAATRRTVPREPAVTLRNIARGCPSPGRQFFRDLGDFENLAAGTWKVRPRPARVPVVHGAHELHAPLLHLLPCQRGVVDQEAHHRTRRELLLAPEGRAEDLHRLPAWQAQDREVRLRQLYLYAQYVAEEDRKSTRLN